MVLRGYLAKPAQDANLQRQCISFMVLLGIVACNENEKNINKENPSGASIVFWDKKMPPHDSGGIGALRQDGQGWIRIPVLGMTS